MIGEYFYDGEGKRVKKHVYSSGVLNEVTVFVYSKGKLIAEYSTEPPPTNPTTKWTVTDLLGSPRILVNSLGEVAARRDFMPFGEEIYPDETHRKTADKYNFGADGVRQKFTGYERDEETGLDFAEARYYYNNHGRFTAVDPLLASGKSANPQTFNRYAYVMNRPFVYTDPTGLQAGQKAKLKVTVANRRPPERETYPVTGKTDVEAWNNASVEGPKNHGGRKAGLYDGKFNVTVIDAPGTYTKGEDGTYTATVTITSVEISITDNYTVPVWQNMNDNDVSEQDRSEWAAEANKLEDHEIGHADIMTDGVNNILKPALEQITVPTGAGQGKSAKEALDNATQNAFDNHIRPVLRDAERKMQQKQYQFDKDNPNNRSH